MKLKKKDVKFLKKLIKQQENQTHAVPLNTGFIYNNNILIGDGFKLTKNEKRLKKRVLDFCKRHKNKFDRCGSQNIRFDKDGKSITIDKVVNPDNQYYNIQYNNNNKDGYYFGFSAKSEFIDEMFEDSFNKLFNDFCELDIEGSRKDKLSKIT